MSWAERPPRRTSILAEPSVRAEPGSGMRPDAVYDEAGAGALKVRCLAGAGRPSRARGEGDAAAAGLRVEFGPCPGAAKAVTDAGDVVKVETANELCLLGRCSVERAVAKNDMPAVVRRLVPSGDKGPDKVAVGGTPWRLVTGSERHAFVIGNPACRSDGRLVGTRGLDDRGGQDSAEQIVMAWGQCDGDFTVRSSVVLGRTARPGAGATGELVELDLEQAVVDQLLEVELRGVYSNAGQFCCLFATECPTGLREELVEVSARRLGECCDALDVALVVTRCPHHLQKI